GEIAERQQSATHIVVSNKFNALVDDFGCEQYIVANEWLWASLRLECCANEEDFQWRQKVGQEKAQVSRCAKSFLSDGKINDKTTCGVTSLGDNGMRTENRCRFMMLNRFKRFKEPLETQLRNKEWKMLSKAEVKCLFSRVEPLICMHETIYNDLKAAIVSRNAVHRFSKACERRYSFLVLTFINAIKVWLDNAVNLRSLYSAYVNNYDAAIETLKQCDRSRPAFHAFLKEAESNADCQRQMLKDLLMRPVQRLPSVMLLLKEMYRKVKKDNRGKKYLLRAINALDDILRTVNESKCQMDSYAEILNICSEIEHCPADLLSSSRTPLGRIHVVSLGGGRNEWTNLRGKTMVIFLFNDLVEIAKTRNIVTDELPSETTITSNALMPPFLSLRSDKKKYKHQKQYMITTIQRIHVIIDDDFDGVFVLSLKGTDEEDFWIAQCLENRSGEMRKFLDDLCIQGSSMYLTGITIPSVESSASCRINHFKYVIQVLLKRKFVFG
ncbi:unnamed protein product, partial [Toxocara canis]|uniref:DH domain-containing protein n=1 Tax=Toxocara canis TaxID=6265 RepID=A0A183V3R7_TOXCA